MDTRQLNTPWKNRHGGGQRAAHLDTETATEIDTQLETEADTHTDTDTEIDTGTHTDADTDTDAETRNFRGFQELQGAVDAMQTH